MNMRSSEELSVSISCSCGGWLIKTEDEDVHECAKCKTPYMKDDVERLESMVRLHGTGNLWVDFTAKSLGLNVVETPLMIDMSNHNREEVPASSSGR